MYPQTSDEQREDRASVRRVCEMVRWYEKNTGCARIKGWPVLKANREQRPAALSEARHDKSDWYEGELRYDPITGRDRGVK